MQLFHVLSAMLDSGDPSQLTKERAQEGFCSRIPNNTEFLSSLNPPLRFRGTRGTEFRAFSGLTWLSSWNFFFDFLLPSQMGKFYLVFGIQGLRLWRLKS